MELSNLMKTRNILFRAYDTVTHAFSLPFKVFGNEEPVLIFPSAYPISSNKNLIFLQLTGLHDREKMPVLEGSVLKVEDMENDFVTENNPGITDEMLNSFYEKERSEEESDSIYDKYCKTVPLKVISYVKWDPERAAFMVWDGFLNDKDHMYREGWSEDCSDLADYLTQDNVKIIGNICSWDHVHA